MVDPLGTIVAAVELVQGAIKFCKQVDGLPQQMTQLGQRLEELNCFLIALEAVVRKKISSTNRPLASPLTLQLGHILANIKNNTAIVFTLVNSNPKKIQDVMDEIDHQRGVLRDFLVLLNSQGLDNLPQPQSPQKTKAKGTPLGPSVSRNDFRLLFVDPHNIARSVVAEVMTRVLGQLTKDEQRKWPIAAIRSAGFFVKHKSDCADMIGAMDYSQEPWYYMPVERGGGTTSAVPMDALFDTHLFKKRYMQSPSQSFDAKTNELANKSKGLRRHIFDSYDYILVFTCREYRNVCKLRELLYRNGIGGGDRAHVVHLGAYLLSNDGPNKIDGGAPKPVEIIKPKANKTPWENRQDWDAKVVQIQLAIEGFLQQEMGWTAPNVLADRGF
ncbi:hypothetical protein B0T17DRAFT_495459 [Bombardia bombarda]|uniref:Uncharacterized protein n=1 Tax=Bombardia bombarda TaxID=252184 RepID=A0AA39WLV5_9PEZI|nr:hypothetical protein B0T17DRAFT_495459 [Bombardia bombarda]